MKCVRCLCRGGLNGRIMLWSVGIDVWTIVALDLYCTLKLWLICICNSLDNFMHHITDFFVIWSYPSHYWMFAWVTCTQFLSISEYLHVPCASTLVFMATLLYYKANCCIFSFFFVSLTVNSPLKLYHCYINTLQKQAWLLFFFFFFHPSVTWHGAAEPSDCDKLGLEMTK